MFYTLKRTIEKFAVVLLDFYVSCLSTLKLQ